MSYQTNELKRKYNKAKMEFEIEAHKEIEKRILIHKLSEHEAMYGVSRNGRTIFKGPYSDDCYDYNIKQLKIAKNKAKQEYEEQLKKDIDNGIYPNDSGCCVIL